MSLVAMDAAFENGHGHVPPKSEMQRAAVALHRGSGKMRDQVVGNLDLRVQPPHNIIQPGAKRDGHLRRKPTGTDVCSSLFGLFVTMLQGITVDRHKLYHFGFSILDFGLHQQYHFRFWIFDFGFWIPHPPDRAPNTLTHRLAVPPLPAGEGKRFQTKPSPEGRGGTARRWVRA